MSAPLTDEDKGFIRAILDHPEELTTWLVYADWLDDRGDPRSEFLRLTAEQRQLSPSDLRAVEIDVRVTELRGTLDPGWMLVFDTAPIGFCDEDRFLCPWRTWDQLLPTDEPDIRICHNCRSPVFYCHTMEEAREFGSCGQRVALSPRISGSEYPPPTPPQLPEIEMDVDEMFPPPPPPPSKPWWKFW